MEEKQLRNAIIDWILDIDDDHTLPEGITALHFGLFLGSLGEISVRQALKVMDYRLDLIGAYIYDPHDDDWACEEDFVPKKRYCPEFRVPETTPWEEVLEVTAHLLKEIVAELDGVAILSVPHITVGFSDGELLVVR